MNTMLRKRQNVVPLEFFLDKRMDGGRRNANDLFVLFKAKLVSSLIKQE